MPINLVECLSCGATRRVVVNRRRPVQQDECARCGYVGWAETASLTEALRRALRDHTVDQRRHVTAW
jgi:Zn ribbon nucleic-acid-binding protein